MLLKVITSQRHDGHFSCPGRNEKKKIEKPTWISEVPERPGVEAWPVLPLSPVFVLWSLPSDLALPRRNFMSKTDQLMWRCPRWTQHLLFRTLSWRMLEACALRAHRGLTAPSWKRQGCPWGIPQRIHWDPSPCPFLHYSHHSIPFCLPHTFWLSKNALAPHPGWRPRLQSCPLRALVTLRCWKFTLELEGLLWSPACLCQQWFQYIIVRLSDSWREGEGREKPIKCWLSVNVSKEMHQQKEPGHTGELSCFALFWISKLCHLNPTVSSGHPVCGNWEERKSMLDQPVSFFFYWLVTLF